MTAALLELLVYPVLVVGLVCVLIDYRRRRHGGDRT